MIYFLHGEDINKISDYISSINKKNSFNKISYELSQENYSEIIGNLDTPNLFGETNLFLINITDSDPEVTLEFCEFLKNDHEVILFYEGSVDQRSKVYKKLSGFKTLEFKNEKNNTIFQFTDFLISQDVKKTYQELHKLNENKEEDLAIFNMIVASFRNIAAIKLDAGLAKKIIPFKVGFYKKYSNEYSIEDVHRIYKTLAENDLKFKTGEITSEMLVLHSINSILKNGINK